MKILFLLDLPLSKNLVSGSLRFFELANILKNHHAVTIAGSEVEKDFVSQDGINILRTPSQKIYNIGLKITIPNKAIIKEINSFDIVITYGRIINILGISKITIPIIFDMYAPWYIEDLVSNKTKSHAPNMKQIKQLLLGGDYFLCATEKQKDMLIGLMLMAGRNEADLASKVGIVPIGIPKDKPVQKSHKLKGQYQGIEMSDKVVAWWGGVWDWLDPITPIKAMEIISKTRSDIKFVFFGVKSSEAGKGISNIAKESIKLSKELGLYNKQIFFIDEWIPYADRADYLLDIDAGVISHFDNLETRFSWRTRALDYIWANIPIVTSIGDAIAEIVQEQRLGITVPHQNPEAFAQAIINTLNNEVEYKRNLEAFAPNLYWGNITNPLIDLIERGSND